MPVADLLIVRDGGDAAPFNEKLPQGAKLSPVTVNAVFDGSGAAADFIPAVVLLNPSGVVIARAADPANVVTAGDSAEVSWFQGVKNAAAAAATGVELCIATTAEPYNIPATGGSPNAATTWASATPATGTFVWPSSGDATKIGLTKQGVYVCAYCPNPVATWPAPASGFITFTLQCSTFGSGFLGSDPFLNTTTSALFAGSSNRRLIWLGGFNLPSADEVRLFAGNSTVGNFAVQETNLFIARLGNSIPGEPI